MKMRTFTIALFAMIVWTGCAGDGDGKIMGKRKADQKYGMESGIITYEAALPQNMGSNKRVLYFDDYGKMEKVVTTTSVLDQGLRTGDIYTDGMTRVGTVAMGDAVVAAL